jgi:mRNA interferase MazF
MKCKRGDVVIVPFPHSSGQAVQPRPALVVQTNNLALGISQVILAMITTNMQRRGHASRVFVQHGSQAGSASGLKSDSVVMTDNLVTVIEKAIKSVIGHLPDMTAVDAALRHALGL